MASHFDSTFFSSVEETLAQCDGCPFFFPLPACSDPVNLLLFSIRAWTYIVLCSDGRYYTGSTTDLDQRLVDHNNGRYGGYTSSRLPVVLAWSQEFSDIRDAIALERRIKGWSRKKKEALIRGDFQFLHELARSTKAKTCPHHPQSS
jgi:putative endonuclease